MKKSNKPFIILVTVLFLLFIIALVFVVKSNGKSTPFSSDTKTVLKEILNKDNKVSPIELAKLIVKNDSNIELIDIRSQYDFIKGHLPNAKNIYKADILDEAHMEYFEKFKNDNKTAIIYGKNAVEANIPFMILQQIGIENIKLLNGDYNFLQDVDFNQIAQMGELDLDNEIAIMDFAKLIESAKSKADIIAKEEEMKIIEAKKSNTINRVKVSNNHKINVVTKKRATSKPTKKEVEEEEDEGC